MPVPPECENPLNQFLQCPAPADLADQRQAEQHGQHAGGQGDCGGAQRRGLLWMRWELELAAGGDRRKRENPPFSALKRAENGGFGYSEVARASEPRGSLIVYAASPPENLDGGLAPR